MKKLIVGILAVVLVLVGGISVAVVTIDPNKFRPQIVELLSKQTGRTVKLEGPIHWHIAHDGLTFGLEQASIGNPLWASRPEMASVGAFDLGVALLPLLDHKLEITRIKLAKADIELETNTAGQVNWEFHPNQNLSSSTSVATSSQSQSTKSLTGSSSSTTTASGTPVSIDVKSLIIADSRVSLRDKLGHVTLYQVDNLALTHSEQGFLVTLKSAMNGTPITLEAKTGLQDLMSAKEWPFHADTTYADYHITMEGKVSDGGKIIDLSAYRVASGASDLHGAMMIKLNGARPSLKGQVLSTHFDPNDFKSKPGKQEQSPQTTREDTTKNSVRPSSEEPQKLFSGSALGLDQLKSADVSLSLKLDDFVMGSKPLHNLTGSLELTSGKLSVRANVPLEKGSINLNATVDGATSPAQFEASLKAPEIELAELLPVLGMKDFVSSKATATVELVSTGDSLHELASHAQGSIVVLSEGGTLSTAALGDIYAGLAQLVSLGSSGSTIGLNCMATRFNIKDGVMTDNGILADTTATTVQMKGGINLGSETMDLVLNSKPKIGKVANIVPPVSIGGTLLKPKYKVDAVNAINNVVSMFLNKGATTTSSVPTVTAVSGQNACVYALDHPVVVATPKGSAPSPAASLKNNANIQNIGKNFMKGLLGSGGSQ